MVFENLTLFELNFEDAQFGPRAIGEADAEDVEVDDETMETGGRRRYVWLVAGVALVAAAAAVRRRRGRAVDADIEIERTDADVETAPEQ